MFPRTTAASHGTRRRQQPWRRPLLALAAALPLLGLLAGPAYLQGLGFAVGLSRLGQRGSRGSAALAARGGEAAGEAPSSTVAEEGLIDAKRAVPELDLLLQHVFRPQPRDQTSLMEWSLERREDDSGKIHRASVTIVPLNRTFVGPWSTSGVKAKAATAQVALKNRLGDNHLGDAQATLSQVLRNAFDGEDARIDVAEAEGGFLATLHLPVKIASQGGSFEGTGKSKQEAKQSAAHAALAYICASIAVLPALKALSEGVKKRGELGRGSKTVVIGNLPPEVSEEDIRERLQEFGKVATLEIKRGKSRSKGSATYEETLSAWAASRMLNRCALDGHVVSVEQRGAKVNVPGRRDTAMSWGKATSPDSVLFYKNAPFNESWTSMLERFREVGDVTSFRYWVDPKTRKSRGSGTIGFASPKAARDALQRLQEMEIQGRKLQVELYKKHEAPTAQ